MAEYIFPRAARSHGGRYRIEENEQCQLLAGLACAESLPEAGPQPQNRKKAPQMGCAHPEMGSEPRSPISFVHNGRCAEVGLMLVSL